MSCLTHRPPSAATRARPAPGAKPRSCLLIRADAGHQTRLPRRGEAQTRADPNQNENASPQLSRRQVLGASTAPLLAALAGALPLAPLATAPPPARAAVSSRPVVPSLEVKAALDKALAKAIPKGKTAVALRLVFHDAGTFSTPPGDGGLNASIQYELDRPENGGLKRGWRIVEQVREDLRGTPAEGVATDADLVALAGAFAVLRCGGPDIPLALGRPVAGAGQPDPPGRMPAENFTAEQLKANFAAKGFSVREMVALSGAHTLGSKGFGDPVRFDNEYYKALLRRPWTDTKDPMATMIGLPSDHVLPDDPDCLPYIQRYAEDQEAFFADFAAAYVKLTSLGVPGWA